MNRHAYEAERIRLYLAEVATCNRYFARPNPKRYGQWMKAVAEARAFRDTPRPNDVPGDDFAENLEVGEIPGWMLQGVTP